MPLAAIQMWKKKRDEICEFWTNILSIYVLETIELLHRIQRAIPSCDDISTGCEHIMLAVR